MSNTLGGYAADRIRAGVTRTEIHDELTAVGWSEEEADAAYREGLLSLGVPVPTSENRPSLTRKSSAADIVVNLFSFIMLGVVATALGTLYFQVVNLAAPDPLDMYYAERSAMGAIHYAIAALLVGFPLYYGSMRIWFRKFREDEGRVESRLSKWLTYIVLLAAAGTVVGDLITAIFTFLQGEITTRFALKALIILAIAGGIFGFYFLERRRIQYRKAVPRAVFQGFGVAVLTAIVAGIVLGFVMGGSPETARARAFDYTRAERLVELSGCIQAYASDIGVLPKSLEDIRRSADYSYCIQSMSDPETGATFQYRIVNPSSQQGNTKVGEYELCAMFSLESTGREGAYGSGGVWLDHEAGTTCKSVTARLGMPAQGVFPAVR